VAGNNLIDIDASGSIVAAQVQVVVAEDQTHPRRMAEAFRPGVQPDVARGPELAKLLTARGQFAHQIGQCPVVGCGLPACAASDAVVVPMRRPAVTGR
jgi:hypothetical protein